MPTKKASKQSAVFESALSLSPRGRAELAEKLWNSLDDEVQSEISAEWARELDRRWSDFQSGKSRAVPGDEAIQGLLRKFRRRQP